MNISDRFLNYTRINTTTNPVTGAQGIMPSCEGQRELGLLLKTELTEMGLDDVTIRDNGIVTATLPANCDDNLPTVAFFAHLDTSAENTNDTHAELVSYQGGDITLKNGLVLSQAENRDLPNYVGDDIFVTDGNSLLGADDKAAIAATMDSLQYFVQNPEVKHGTVKVAFLPDEEQGLLGAKAFAQTEGATEFADFGYTLDCCGIGEFVHENWNAGNAVVEFIGQSAHPMNSKGNLKNSLLMAQKFMALFPATETPEATEGREGYFWMKKLAGNSAKTVLNIDIRDFFKDSYARRMKFIETAVDSFKAIYGEDSIKLAVLKDRYPHVANYLTGDGSKYSPVELALSAYKENCIAPKVIPMRGGYDGAVLSEGGIPCPNIFTGAHNFHSVFEYLPLSSLKSASSVVQTIIKNIAKAN